MELRHLRYFVAIAEELNLRRAADRLHISHPPLSRQLRDLEQEVGVALVARGKRGLALSEAGILFLAEARAILAQAGRAIEGARQAGRGEAGRLRIAYSFGYFEPALARSLKAFRERFPLVSIEVHQLDPQAQIDQLLRKSIDVAFVGVRSPGLQDRVEFRCVRRAPIRVALPLGHDLAAREPVALADLAREPFVSLSGGFPDYPAWLYRHCVSAGFQPRVAHEVDTNSTLFGLVSAGFGVALLPALHDPPACAVAFRSVSPALPLFEFDLAVRREDGSPVLERFLGLLAEQG